MRKQSRNGSELALKCLGLFSIKMTKTRKAIAIIFICTRNGTKIDRKWNGLKMAWTLFYDSKDGHFWEKWLWVAMVSVPHWSSFKNSTSELVKYMLKSEKNMLRWHQKLENHKNMLLPSSVQIMGNMLICYFGSKNFSPRSARRRLSLFFFAKLMESKFKDIVRIQSPTVKPFVPIRSSQPHHRCQDRFFTQYAVVSSKWKILKNKGHKNGPGLAI